MCFISTVRDGAWRCTGYLVDRHCKCGVGSCCSIASAAGEL
ncbi:hypothetical protein M3J09_012261 [Ascochyta lentis]